MASGSKKPQKPPNSQETSVAHSPITNIKVFWKQCPDASSPSILGIFAAYLGHPTTIDRDLLTLGGTKLMMGEGSRCGFRRKPAIPTNGEGSR